MWQRNNGQAEDDLQFRFTAYLVSAVKRRRKDYLIQLGAGPSALCVPSVLQDQAK